MRDGGQYETIRDLANKLPEHTARLATVLDSLALCVKTQESSSNSSKEYSGPTVSATALASTMTVVQHYASEAVRLSAAGFVDPKLSMAVRLLDWLRKWLLARECDVVSLAEMYQFGPPQIRSPGSQGEAIRLIESHGWLVQVPGGAEIDGERNRATWREAAAQLAALGSTQALHLLGEIYSVER